MQTIKRLMRAYQDASVLEFNRDSKYVFISDCHRGNGSTGDEFSKNRNTYIHAMTHYFDNGFTYVEVGDGDELWEAGRISVIQEAHTDAVNAIKRFHDAGRMIMIYGNHNMRLRDLEYVKYNYYRYYNEFTERFEDLFPGLQPIEALRLVEEETRQEIFVVHGHQGDLANDQLWFVTKFSLRYFWRYFHNFGIKNPASPVKNIFKRHKIEKNYIKWIEQNRMMLICGHTHRFKYPRSGELPYFNTGCCVYPTTITAIELENGQISLIRWKLLVNSDAVLQVQRMVLKGPEPIEKFDLREADPGKLASLYHKSVVGVEASRSNIEGSTNIPTVDPEENGVKDIDERTR